MRTPENTALLIMDMQQGVVPRLEAAAALPAQLSSVADAARAAGVTVIFVGVAFLPGHPEIGPRSSMAALKQAGVFTVDDPAVKIHDGLEVKDGDVIVTKKRFSAFSGSELETILRANDITDLVLAGIVTSGVVLSTVREASDKDYTLTVLSDGCMDYDEEVHRVLVEKVFPRQADVVTIADWVGSLG